MSIPIKQMKLDDLKNDLKDVEMNLQIAIGEDRNEKIKLKKNIKDEIRRLEKQLDLSNNKS